ncbi:UDP-glycosyltransferase UGT5-like isoform X1 [Achroia grisella]|uniref:UDP-glycosyltransferase UGT5-like isoform X1 n=1 Tax=Achroia grisella TaxID=688607 RepID=UPI0027D2B76A|nr:UDP-glycosyltransferase UGT5-like isoform X1 [Achroia grisella]
MCKYVILIFILIILNLNNVFGFNILAIISGPFRSHYMAFHPLFREISKRGHNITVINHFPDEDTLPNFKFVNLQNDEVAPSFSTLEYYENSYTSLIQIINLLRHVIIPASGPVEEECKSLFTHENMKVHRSKGVQYDVIFVEQFLSDCALVYAATMYDAPIIGITSHVLMPWTYPRLGIPFDIASDPFYFSSSGPNPSLLGKMESALGILYLLSYGRWQIHECIYKVFSEYLPENLLDIESVAKERMKMVFAYQHYSVTGARLLPPQALEIGGMHVGRQQPVPTDIEEFLANADHGVIYFSFGSNLKSNTMSEKKLQQFLEAFRRIPQKILWKWEDDNFPKGNDNVYTKKWMPQLDVLCHPKVIAFISHGGMLSLSEAAHCGKPMLAIPFFGDQFSNAASIRHVGLGKTILFERIDTENLVAALKEITSPDMQNNAKNISKLWHDRPQNVMDSAIYWTEYVARHGTGPPSMPSKLNTWFENMLLDVYCVFILLFLLIIGLCYSIVKLIKIIIVKLLSLIFVKKAKIQ